MSSSIGVFAFIATLTIMIVFHEFGHFLAAKRVGMKVEEFFIGFGPRLMSTRRGETEYGVKAILLGGYVRIAGMNPWQTIPESELPRTYGAKPSWQRAIVLLAGSATHMVMAFFLLFVTFAVVGIPELTTTLDVVEAEIDGRPAPARQAGLLPKDRIVSIDGSQIDEWDDVRQKIRASPGRLLTVGVERDGSFVAVELVPLEVEITEDGEQLRIGVVGVLPDAVDVRRAPQVAAWESTKTTGQLIGGSVLAIGRVFSPRGLSKIFGAVAGTGDRGADQPSGLVGGARVAGQAAEAGELQSLLGLLSGFIVFVGVINLVPLPPLDGGHLLVLAIEKVRKRRIDMRKVVPLAMAVIAFFAALQITLLYPDIVRPAANPFQ